MRPVTLRPVEAWAGDVEASGVVERERRKKRELAGELNKSAMRELGAGRRAGWRNRSAMKVGRRAEG